MAVGTGSVLARSSYKKVRNFSLAASTTEQKQPGVPVTSPAEGGGRHRPACKCRQYTAPLSGLLHQQPPPAQNANPQTPYPSTCRGSSSPCVDFELCTCRQQCFCAGSFCGAGLVFREGGFKSVSKILFSNKFLHSWIPHCPLLLVFVLRVSDLAVTPWQTHPLPA